MTAEEKIQELKDVLIQVMTCVEPNSCSRCKYVNAMQKYCPIFYKAKQLVEGK